MTTITRPSRSTLRYNTEHDMFELPPGETEIILVDNTIVMVTHDDTVSATHHPPCVFAQIHALKEHEDRGLLDPMEQIWVDFADAEKWEPR